LDGNRAFWAAASFLVSGVTAATANEAPWIRARSAHVEVVSDGTPDQARQAAEGLEVFHRVLQSALGGMPGLFASDAPPPLALAFRAGAYPSYVPRRDGDPQEADGFILGGADRTVIAVDLGAADPGEALAHEYTHFALNPVLPAQPAWLGEGLAQLLAGATVWPDAATLGRASETHLRRLRAGAMPLRELLAVGYLSPTYLGRAGAGDRRALFYAQSWALAHWIVAGGHGGLPAVGTYAAAIASGADEAAAFEGAFGMTVEAADASLRAYLAALPLPSVSVPLPRPAGADLVEVSAVDAASMDVALGDLLARQGRSADARAHFERALRGGAMAAHEGLAGLLLAEGKLDEARRHVEAALAADPDDARALQRRAEHLVREVARRGDVLSEAETDRAAAVLERALAKNPDLADAAELLARLRPAPLAHRIALLQRAVARQPERADLAFTLASLHARRNDLAAAARVLRRARERTRDDAQRFLSDHLLARVGAVASGQRQAQGVLEAVDCLPGGALAFRVRTTSGVLRLAADSPRALFVFDAEGETVERDFTCGPASARVTARYLTLPTGEPLRLLSLTFDAAR
jgi:tetratricopeptide (TPR) repeat protein